MKCQNCGVDIPEGKIYCENCGNAIQMVPDYNPVDDIAIGAEEKNQIKESESNEVNGRKTITNHRFRNAMMGVGLMVFGWIAFQVSYEAVRNSKETVVEPEEPVLLDSPKFSVRPGTYNYSPLLTMSHDQRNEGNIYYTTDGTKPSAESNIYNNPVEIGEGQTTIRAIFISRDGTLSEEMEGTYEVVFDLPAEPEFSVPSGEYSKGFQVTLTSEEGCKIHYTTNGEEPTYDSPVYRGPIYIPSGLTVLQAVAVDEEGGMSAVMEAIYNVSENFTPKEEDLGPLEAGEAVNP